MFEKLYVPDSSASERLVLPVLLFSMPVTIVAAYCILFPTIMAARCPTTIPTGRNRNPKDPPSVAIRKREKKKLTKKKKTAGAHGAHNIRNGLETAGKCLC